VTCPRCGAEVQRGQDWCLVCGHAARTRVASTPRWKVPVVVTALVTLLALGALAFAFVDLTEDPPAPAAATSTAPTTTAPAPAQTAPPAAATPGVATTPGATTPTPTTPGASGGAQAPTATTGVGQAER